jgi:hypothetical protein
MQPAFSTNRGAAAFGVLLLFCLSLPFILRGVGLPSRSEFYKGIPQQAGAFVYLRHQVYEDRSDVDILFFGNSLMRVAIDEPYVRQALGRIKPDANTLVCGFSWQGYDLQYYVLRDLLAHRKVKMVVLAMPTEQQNSAEPHVQLYRVLRYGDYPDALQGLPLRARLSIYGEMVLGAPRQALNLLRPNIAAPEPVFAHSTDPPERREIGFNGRPFIRHVAEPPAIAAEQMIFSPATRDQFDFAGSPVNNYQLHFIREIAALVHQHGALLVVLHIPLASERAETRVHERMFWPDLIGADMAMVGVPSAELFQGIPRQQILDFYEDEHLNRNGQELFTKTITPALVTLYAEHFGSNEAPEDRLRLSADRGAALPVRLPAGPAHTAGFIEH